MATVTARGLTRAVLWVCLSFASSGLLAQTHSAAADLDAAPPAPKQPEEIVRDGVMRLKQFVNAYQDPSADQVREFLDSQIAPSFDFPYMAKWAAGPYYRRLDDAQKERFTEVLSNTFLSALGRNLGSYAKPLPEVVVSAAQPGRTSSETVVAADVTAYGSLKIQLLFRFYWSPDGWKIFDVSANGASAVGYYRRYYVDLLRRHGPDYVLQ